MIYESTVILSEAKNFNGGNHMTQKMKLIVGIAVFVAVIAGAGIAYNILSKNIVPENSIAAKADEIEEVAEVEAEEVDSSDDVATDVRDGFHAIPHHSEASSDNMTTDEAETAESGDDTAEEKTTESTAETDDNNQTLAPDFTMQDQEGSMVKLSEMIDNGKPIVMNFWASWCPPCKNEMPDFEKVYQELGEEVQFVMVDLTDGRRETVEIGSQYIEEQGFTFPVFFDVNQEGAINYRMHSIPVTIFINKDGYMVTGAQGAIDEETLRRGIELIR